MIASIVGFLWMCLICLALRLTWPFWLAAFLFCGIAFLIYRFAKWM